MLVLSVVSSTLLGPRMIMTTAISITSNLISSIRYLSQLASADSSINELIITNDVLHDIIIIKTFIEELEKKPINDTMTVSIRNLGETLQHLEQNIHSVTQKIESHKTLWFSSFRSYNLSDEKKNIPFLINQLKHRFELLIKLGYIKHK